VKFEVLCYVATEINVTYNLALPLGEVMSTEFPSQYFTGTLTTVEDTKGREIIEENGGKRALSCRGWGGHLSKPSLVSLTCRVVLAFIFLFFFCSHITIVLGLHTL
jgi:hypothetical protein